VYEPGSPEFASALARLFGPEDIERLRPILPFCLFVKNGTGGYLAALTIVYEIPEIVMPTGKPYRITISPRTDVRNRLHMGEPGKVSFISPAGAIQGNLKPDGTPDVVPVVSERAIRFYLDHYASRQVNVSVDSIIDEDGILDGPDEIGLLDKVNAELKAQWDILEGIKDLHGEQLAAALAPTSRVGLASGQKHDWYVRTRQDYLERLGRYLEQVGEEQLMTEAKASALFHQIKRRGTQ
jgi:hypothetical protein